jgi:hypothetical protein
MRTRRSGVALAALLALVPASGPGRAAEDESVVQEVLGILRERGLVDPEEYERLALKNASYEKKQAQTFLSKIQWSGDVRLRVENFWYDDDDFDTDQPDRDRFRYRLRLAALAPIHDSVDAGFRLVSGEDDLRSQNQSAGRVDEDFDPDSIFLDQAYIVLKAPKDWMGEGGFLRATGGKMANPFLWKNSRDNLLWDNDITPEGGALQLALKPAEPWTLYANAGYFVLDENTAASDPHVLGVQGGLDLAATDAITLGARASGYEWHSLDADFFQRGIDGTGGSTSSAGGNLPGGLTDDGSFGAGELAVYLRWVGVEDWPVRAFGHFARNFDAEAVAGADAEDLAWNVGLEAGDAKRILLVGVNYYEIQANVWPSQFTESDLFDGFTNRKGWAFYAVRQVFTNTELSVALLRSFEIEDDQPTYDDSLVNAERFRLQTDLLVRF